MEQQVARAGAEADPGHARPDLDAPHVVQAQAEGRNADEQVRHAVALIVAGSERRAELEEDPLGRRRRLHAAGEITGEEE